MLIETLCPQREDLLIGAILCDRHAYLDDIIEVYRLEKSEFLLQIDRPGPRKARTKHSGYVGSNKHAVRDTLFKARGSSIRLLKMHRIIVAAEASESLNILCRDDVR